MKKKFTNLEKTAKRLVGLLFQVFFQNIIF